MTSHQHNQRTPIIDVEKIIGDAISVLDSRSRDVLIRRFGLKKKQKETLESIGRQYGITRERVRQIEAHAKKSLQTLPAAFRPVKEMLEALFARAGGILTENQIEKLVQQGGAGQVANILFCLDTLPGFTYVAHDRLFHPHWKFEPALNPHAAEVVVAAQKTLEATGHPIPAKDLTQRIRGQLRERIASVSSDALLSILEASTHIGKTALSEWGLTSWAEVSPRGVGDKAYAVLRRHKKPEHFRRITELINEAHFDNKKANAQTVHNELIKDDRFVLVGRGLYGLREWGYVPGTVADVLESILRKSQHPLSRDELIEKVLQQRLVKKNTIVLGLQNNKRFVRTSKNHYTLREKS